MAKPRPPRRSGHERRIGLVLGAGGATGAAFHAGALLAMQQDLGWDPRDADVIVGSSAGSIVGGLLRSGMSTDDLAAWGASVAASPEGRSSRSVLDAIESSRYRITAPRPRLPIPSPSLLAQFRHPSQIRPHTAALSLLPFGFLDAASALAKVGDLSDGWPASPLWVTAVRITDARRVVFGRDRTDVPLGRAIAASCAIPALFRPVRIDGHRHIDGGAHSPTNADLLADAQVDVAVVLSPMSARGEAVRGRRDRVLRTLFARRLDAERAQLERAGIEVHVLEPDGDTLGVMGLNALARRRTGDVVRTSFLATGRALLGSGLADVLRARAATSTPERTPLAAVR